MTAKIVDDSTVLSVRISAEVKEQIRTIAAQIGLSPSVYVRKMLYELTKKTA